MSRSSLWSVRSRSPTQGIGYQAMQFIERCGPILRYLIFLLAGLTSLGAIAPWCSKNQDGQARRLALQSFSEDFSPDQHIPVYRACRLVHSLTEHTDGRRVAWYENWIQWSVGHIYAPLKRTQLTERILEQGHGDCSERVAVLQALFQKWQVTTRIHGLGGHVVLEVFANGKWYTLDPDYGVTYPRSFRELQHGDERLVADALLRKGYSADVVDRYVEILRSSDDNILLPPHSALSPRLYRIELICEVLLVILPCGLWSILVVLWPTFARPE